MTYIIITYAGAPLEIPAWLASLWPHDLLLDAWPTYCGAGEGLGDFFVPDTIEGAYVNPACFIHDLDWAVADGSMEAFHAANERFRLNLKELVSAQIFEDGSLVKAYSWCNIYFSVVDSKVGEQNYQPTGQDPFTNPVVKQKLQRLAYAAGGIPMPIAGQ